MSELLPPERAWEETVADQLAVAVEALISGSVERARLATGTVATELPGRTIRKSVSLATQLKVFRRDRFICRYCGQRTLFLPTVRVLSHIFPEHLPVDPGWKLDHTHPVYWTLIASADHLIPAIRGGSSEEENLVTSCWRCNDIKRAWSVQELRWTLLDPPTEDAWDGLSASYPELCSAVKSAEGLPLSQTPYHQKWLRVFAQLSK